LIFSFENEVRVGQVRSGKVRLSYGTLEMFGDERMDGEEVRVG
jgi:hypothetical protein